MAVHIYISMIPQVRVFWGGGGAGPIRSGGFQTRTGGVGSALPDLTREV